MNVRFSNQGLRCRTSRSELDRLLAGRAVELELALPRDHVFRFSVRPTTLSNWSLETDPTGVWLTIPRAELEALAESLPRKEGLQQTFDASNGASVAVAFEVDLKKEAVSGARSG
ncbi:MAG TPA: hypothetical protein VK025_03330 [Steroidobacter sp.]|jgi:hypothetical protein|nr:hypothetical protein [Steroidobacteraceae bacterium]HLS80416.1 hypothetical protein [Steroidobacter sp.]